MANRIQLRRDGAQQWANVNPVLAQGELGIELDTSRLKIGDGVTPWNSLKYERPLETESNTANTLVKRDADGNFEAGAITASLIGNAATATRLASARSFTLTGDMSGSASFDGSANINITAELNYQPGLPHYDPNDLSATGTYTQLVIDSRGRVVTGSTPTTLGAYGIADAQPLNGELTSLSTMTGFGLISRSADDTLVNRQIVGSAARILVADGTGTSANPTIDLADTPVVVGSYNPVGNLDTPLVSVTTGDETVNTTNFTVDRYGRLTAASTSAIATATQGTEAPAWNSGTTYARNDQVKNSNDRLYQAILAINSGGSEPNHTDTSDTGSWRYLGSALTAQKGLAAFDQEDFDVTTWSAGSDEGGFVKIADAGVDNNQLQNSRISFADGNTKEDFDLDQELTATTGYRGFNYLNYAKINDTSGNLLFSANNTGDGGAGEVDINVRTVISDPDIFLDGATDQLLEKNGDGNFEIRQTQNSSSDRVLNIMCTNSGAGEAAINITADQGMVLTATHPDARVCFEHFHAKSNILACDPGNNLVLDPDDNGQNTGTVEILGDLLVQGTTTTVNSTTITVDDPIITLGGDTAPTTDDNKDRGVEFRYYDSQARVGFFGWDESYANANIWSGTGGYRFLYNATNSSEIFTGTDAALIAGNLALTTNTGSTSTTTGTLVVTGGVGISEKVNVGDTVTIAGQTKVTNNIILEADNKEFAIKNQAGVDKFTVDSDNGNTVIKGTTNADGDAYFYSDFYVRADNKGFMVQNANGDNLFWVDTDNGNFHTDGTMDIDSGATLNSTLDVDGNTTLNAELDVDGDVVFHNDFLMDVTGKTFKINNGTADKFTVSSTNGNTVIEGTLNVTSATTLANNLTANGSLTTIGNANSDVFTVNSVTTFTDNITVNGTVDFDTTLNVDGAVDMNDTVTIDGTTTIYDDVIFQSDNKVFNIRNNAAQTQFAVDFDNGNTEIGRNGLGTATAGLLTVHGDTLLNRDLVVDGNTTIGDASGDSLTVNATPTFNANVSLATGVDLTVGGNATVDGNLVVHGTTTTVNSTVVTLDDPIITLGGDTAPGSDDGKDRGVEFRYYSGSAKLGWFGWDNSASRFALFNDATNSSEVFAGDRSGIDAGSLKLFDTTNATNSATGTLIVGGGAGIGLDLFVGDDLTVTDDASIGGNLDVTGTLDVTDDFAINTAKFTVDAGTGNTIIQGTVQVDGNATIGNGSGDQHTVTGTVTFNQAITSTDITADNIKIGVDAANEISTSSGNLVLDSDGGTVNVTDDLDVDNNLNVDGNAKVDGTFTVDGNATIGNASGDAHSVTGTVTFNQAVTSTDITADDIRIGVDASNEISTVTGNLVLDSAGGKVHITDNAEVDGTFQVDGNATIGSASTDSHSVTGTVTFNQAVTSTDITADNIKIAVDGSSEISTSAGDLTLDSNTGETIVDDNLTVNGTLDVDALTTITDSLNVKADNKLFTVQTGAGATIFSVDTDNGNTDIQGTLNVEGATTIDDTLNVTQAVDLDTTLNVDGTATIQDDLIVKSDNKSFKVQTAAGADKFTIDTDNGNTDIQGTLDVNGATNVTNTLGVTGLTSLTNNTNPTSLSGNAALMVTAGGVTVDEDVYVGSDLFLGPNAGTTITLNGASGNANFGGTLDVTGTSTLTTVNASSVTTTAGVTVGGSIIVNSTKFTVAGATGNTVIDGTLDVNEATTVTADLNVTGAVDFDTTLNVDGNSTFSGTITQNSTSLFKDDVVVKGSTKTLKLQNGSGTTKVELQSTSGNITAAGLTTTNSLDVTTNTTIGGTLGVTGQITGNVTGALTGNADTATLVGVTDTTSSNLTYYPTFVSSNTGNTEVRTDSTNLTYNPSTNRLTVSNFRSTTDFEVQGNLTITGNITYGQSQVGSIANHDTDALSEGSTNLYFTNERVDDRVDALITGGTGITATYDDAGNILTLSTTQADINTDNVTEGSTNLFTTAARTRGHFTYGTGITHSSGTLSVTQSDIDTDNVTEGSTNLFTTAARTRGHLGVGGDLAYNASTGVYSYTTPTTIASLSNHDTDDVAEGSSNLYYTDERVDDRLNALIIAGTGVTKVYDDAANTYTLSVTQADINSDTITEGSTNLFTTAARTRGHISVGGSLAYNSGTGVISYTTPDTDGVSEGSSNLYHTTARARAAISENSTQLAYNSTTGVLTYTQGDTDTVSEGSSNLYYTDARADARIAAADTDDLSEGSSNLYYTDARARGAVSAGGDLSYNSGTGVFSITKSSKADLDVDHLITLTGVSAASDNLGTFTGTTIADNETTKGALQDLETAVETKLASSAVSAYGATLVDDADAAAARTTLGLGSAATTASTAYATAAQGTQATTNDSDIDDLYTELNAIGNDASVTTVAQLKAALAALSR